MPLCVSVCVCACMCVCAMCMCSDPLEKHACNTRGDCGSSTRVCSFLFSPQIVPPFYGCFAKRKEEDRLAQWQEFLKNVKFLTAQKSIDGPYFLGKEPGMVSLLAFHVQKRACGRVFVCVRARVLVRVRV